ncbi:MAG: hypothetical protein COB01_01395 [Lutibacter sp.]|nr:MAG: hypothetical protein COB01_01395 [Lutibacter sp.]
MIYKVYRVLLLVVLSILISNCAKIGRPTGGKKDSIAPILVSATPNHKSINFKAKKIKISFNEYIKLKDVAKQLVISPPQKYAPIITPLGTASKFIKIVILDTLDSNTTYAFNFGNSIVDNNEENELGNFKYVFSTGTYIDSLNFAGEVSESLESKPINDIDVMLYEYNDSFTDSIIFKEKPRYISNTLDSTLFDLTNLRAGKYLLIALKDVNDNKIYNPKIDKIGFIKDTITIPTDTSLTITLFKEILPFKLSRPIENSKGRILFGFEGNGKNLNIKLLGKTPSNFKHALVFEKGKDTLTYWYNNLEKDSLSFEVKNVNFLDTISVKLRSSKQDTLVLKTNISSTLELRDTFSISSSIPITQFDTAKITLINKDSISIPFSVKIDAYKTKLFINFEKELNTSYNLRVLPKTITDIFENTNDTLSYKFSTRTLESYGIINITVSNVISPMIIELLTEKNELVSSNRIEESTTLNFSNLVPKNYIVRAIFDDNNNGVWDTGNYLKKIYPEKIQYFNTVLELKANWEENYTFMLK